MVAQGDKALSYVSLVILFLHAYQSTATIRTNLWWFAPDMLISYHWVVLTSAAVVKERSVRGGANDQPYMYRTKPIWKLESALSLFDLRKV